MVSISGCSKRYQDLPAFAGYPIFNVENNSVGRFKTSYLADQIDAYYRGNTAAPIAVSTFVDVDNLYNTSSFGRILGEQLISELVMKGYSVVELRRSDSFQIMEGEGEFALSRELERIKKNHDLAGVVVGTYSASPSRVYLNARIIDPNSSMIVSAGSVEMSKTEEIAKMLRTNSWPVSMERIPVRALAMDNHLIPYYWPYGGRALSNSEDSYDREPARGTDIPKAKKSSLVAPLLKLEPTS